MVMTNFCFKFDFSDKYGYHSKAMIIFSKSSSFSTVPHHRILYEYIRKRPSKSDETDGLISKNVIRYESGSEASSPQH
jgi:hypothetical protein